MQEVYLDNSATTKVIPEVAAIIQQVTVHDYGNPSSLYRKGVQAWGYLKKARAQIALPLGVSAQEIIFTSGGTEANNLAIKGVARRHRRRGKHLITSRIEHPSVLYCFQSLEKEGFQVTYLNVNRDGVIDLHELQEALSPKTTLVSIMHINNEIGSIQPVEEIAAIIKNYNPQIIFHVDAIQSLGKIPFKPGKWRIDLASLSAHKLHGPKGVGGLFLRRGLLIEPLICGGNQENNLRPGTENVAGIAGFGKAVALAAAQMETRSELLFRLKTLLYHGVMKNIAKVRLNGPACEDGAPHILNLSFPGVKGEVLLHALEGKGIFVSTGSACHAHRPEPSPTLTALGLQKDELGSSLRFSFSFLNNAEQINYTIDMLKENVQELRRFSQF